MTKHVPVLLPEVLEYLEVQPGETALDATIGSGGYARAITTSLGPNGTFVGLDADAAAIEQAKSSLAEYEGGLCLKTANFRNLETVLEECEVSSLDVAVFDLGFRSEQLEMERGFSFRESAPLIMTFTHPDDVTEADVTAYDVVNDWSEESLKNILDGYGNERYSERIAAGIISDRRKQPIETTDELVRVIKKSVPAHYRQGRRHPATRTFQAIRIAVNDEVTALKEGMEAAFGALGSDGRLAIVSFHSLEDRTVKSFFAEMTESGRAQELTDSPITAGPEEVDFNPRSRSAKLRVIKKMSN